MFANNAAAQSLSTYGTPGLIDLPTAQVLKDGGLSFTTSGFGGQFRSTATFQFLPRVYGSFRYAVIKGYDPTRDRFDRSFDLHFQIANETRKRPAIAVGLRDFGGTGIYSSEYVVATKSVGERLSVTGGLGWGRLAGRGAFSNPLGLFGDRLRTRPASNVGGISTTGQLDIGNWFRGDVSPFFGLSWKASDQLTLFAEYSPDRYSREVARDTIDIKSPVNVAAEYRFKNGVRVKAFAVGGTEFGAQLSYVFDPAKRQVIGDANGAAPSLVRRSSLAAVDWNRPTQNGRDSLKSEISARFAQEGMLLEGFDLNPTGALVFVRNDKWDVEAQAAGRAARILANTLAPQIETFTIIFQRNGVPITKITTRRSDLEDLQFDYDGAWRSLARAQIEDAFDATSIAQPNFIYPTFDFAISPYAAFSFFDPDNPVRADFGPQIDVAYRPAPGWTLSTTLRYPLLGNLDQATRRSNSVIQRVRSDAVLYAQQSELEINQLTAEYMFRPGPDMFGRVTAGYLENMYGGLSAEMLWYPIDSRFAVGAEINYAKQRDFDMLLGFRDYSVVTGHASAYFDMRNGFFSQLDVGRYLAGDWGATLSIDREFNNGFRVGGYFTLTDVSFDDFGEGSFDKGIRIEVPISWLTGKPSKGVLRQTIQPVLRDGGARLKVNNRLHRFVRDYRGQELRDGWGRYFR